MGVWLERMGVLLERMGVKAYHVLVPIRSPKNPKTGRPNTRMSVRG